MKCLYEVQSWYKYTDIDLNILYKTVVQKPATVCFFYSFLVFPFTFTAAPEMHEFHKFVLNLKMMFSSMFWEFKDNLVL